MKLILDRWFVALGAVTAFCVLSVLLLDLPLLRFFSDHYLVHQEPLTIPIYLSLAVVMCGLAAIPGCALSFFTGRRMPRPAIALALAGCAGLCAVAVNDFLLKPAFGRSGINEYFAASSRYEFAFLGGTFDSSFPSGHTALIAPFLLIFWVMYPRWRMVYGIAAAAFVVSMVAARWHFLSDIVAGGFVGATFALGVLALSRLPGRIRIRIPARPIRARPAQTASLA